MGVALSADEAMSVPAMPFSVHRGAHTPRPPGYEDPGWCQSMPQAYRAGHRPCRLRATGAGCSHRPMATKKRQFFGRRGASARFHARSAARGAGRTLAELAGVTASPTSNATSAQRARRLMRSPPFDRTSSRPTHASARSSRRCGCSRPDRRCWPRGANPQSSIAG